MIIWGLVALVGFLLFETFADLPQIPSPLHEATPTPTNEVNLAVQLPTCNAGARPSNGAIRILDPSVMRRTDIAFSGVRFENRYATAVIVTLMVMDRGVASLFVNPGEKAELSTPVGDYGLAIQWGFKWCNTDRGFEDSHQVSVTDRIRSHRGQTTDVVIESDPREPSKLLLTTREATPPVSLRANDGSERLLELRADAQGHYHVGGTLNGRVATFLVDTGASSVTISRKFANEAGIYQCRLGGRSETANGPVDVCIASGVSIEFGPFRVADAEVSIVPNMAVDALLGMSVLRTLDIRQADGVMKIKPSS